MESKSREQFETWFSDSGKHPKAIERDELGYKWAAAENQWQAWKQSWRESRTALVVELPPVSDVESDDTDIGYNICHQSVQQKLIEQSLAFQVQGSERWITVKGEGDEANANDS